MQQSAIDLKEFSLAIYEGSDEGLPPVGDYMTLKEYISSQSLSKEDALVYQHLFALHNEKKWLELDAASKQLKRHDLMPWLLGERFANAANPATSRELHHWLRKNAFMPQAAVIHKRLMTMNPEMASSLNPLMSDVRQPAAKRLAPASLTTNMTPSQRSVMVGAQRLFSGGHYGAAFQAANTLATNARKTLPGARWLAGLSALHLQRGDDAYRAFATIAAWSQSEGHDEWRAQSHFWAYRLALKAGNKDKAEQHLASATQDHSSFYGLLANATANEMNNVLAANAEVSTQQVSEPVLRLIAMTAVLHEAGQLGDAEKLLRASFTQVKPHEQQALIWTASALQLSDVQLPLASQMAVSDVRSHYPMPNWSQSLKVDPALVLAIVRRESGFDPDAGSHAGAQGLMQIIPSTYHYMVNKESALDVEVANDSTDAFLSVASLKGGLRDPQVNLRVGQRYLKYLQEQPYIGENLVYLIAAYNAGPGSMQAWADQMQGKDPLLFIESIPYRETREYVKNVMTDYWIYSYLMQRPYPTLDALSQNQWPEASL
ncbi:MAG: lytic transglycosylase domain-containing protein [Rickettsiales bacterium]|nr:lytic transglycosylase domain-containing protein [Rickettsiales bacterium]